MLQRIHLTKGPLLDALEPLYGPRHLSTSTTRNCCFFLLERLEASWMKHFVSSLLLSLSQQVFSGFTMVSESPLFPPVPFSIPPIV